MTSLHPAGARKAPYTSQLRLMDGSEVNISWSRSPRFVSLSETTRS